MGMQRVRHGAKDNYWQPVIVLTLRRRVITQPHGKISMQRCALRPQGALCHGVITTFLVLPLPLSRDRGGICNVDGASTKKKKGLNLTLGPGLSQIWFPRENSVVSIRPLKGPEYLCCILKLGLLAKLFLFSAVCVKLQLRITPPANPTQKQILFNQVQDSQDATAPECRKIPSIKSSLSVSLQSCCPTLIFIEKNKTFSSTWI